MRAFHAAIAIGGLFATFVAASGQTPLPQPQPKAPCPYVIVGPDQSAPGGVFAGPRLNAGPHLVWVSPRDDRGGFSIWYPAGPFTVKVGDKYLVQVRDGAPPTATWIANDVRLGQYPQPAGVGVPYFENASQRRIDYGFAVCPIGAAPTPTPGAGPPCPFDVIGPWDRQSAPGSVFAGRRLAAGQYFVWVAPKDAMGKLGAWSKSGPYTLQAGDKYLVEVRDGSPPTVSWRANDVRLGQYPQPEGVGVPYYYNGSESGRDYAIAVCPAAGVGGTADIAIGTSDGFRFGFSIPGGKRLTYSDVGSTNTTVAKVDGLTGELGTIAGKIVETEVKTSDGGVQASWVMSGVRFTQTLRPVASSGGARDSVLIRWTIRNDGTSTRSVGLRTQIDTLIGNNDGVPFMVPGLGEMVRTTADFPKQGPIPAFVQALELPDLKNPGTVAHITLKVAGVEPPDRVSLTRWPGGNVNWEIPLTPMGSDSAIVLYWNERALSPGASREIGFSYGLGAVASSEGRLGTTTVASAASGRDFPITAYVQNPQPNETVTIEPPEGIAIRGDRTVLVPPPPAGSKGQTSIVTWNASAVRPGTFDVTIRSSTGDVQRQNVAVVADDAQPAPPTGQPPVGDPTLATLIGELKDGDPAIRLKAAKMLGRMGAAADALPALRLAANDADADVRRVAADSVQAIEAAVAALPSRNDDVARCIADLANSNEAIRLRAAKELGQFGPAARDAIPALERALQDLDADVRRVAAASLARIRGDATSPPRPEPPPPPSPDMDAFVFKARVTRSIANAAETFDSDLFNLTLQKGERVEVSVVGDGSSDVDLWVHDAANNLLVKEIGLTDKESATFIADANPHAIEVRNLGATNSCTLTVKAPRSIADGFRPMVVRRSILGGETDVFSLPFQAGRSYKLTLKGDSRSRLAFNASLDAEGIDVPAQANGDIQSIALTPRRPGSVRIAVINQGTEPNRYSLMIGE